MCKHHHVRFTVAQKIPPQELQVIPVGKIADIVCAEYIAVQALRNEVPVSCHIDYLLGKRIAVSVYRNYLIRSVGIHIYSLYIPIKMFD